MLAQLLSVAAAAAVAGKCATEEDCSLAGLCVAGVCRCDAAWKPPNCVAMNLLPVNKSAMGYDRGLKNASTPSGFQSLASWGGQSVFEDGEWHMIMADFEVRALPRATLRRPVPDCAPLLPALLLLLTHTVLDVRAGLLGQQLADRARGVPVSAGPVRQEGRGGAAVPPQPDAKQGPRRAVRDRLHRQRHVRQAGRRERGVLPEDVPLLLPHGKELSGRHAARPHCYCCCGGRTCF